MNSLKKKSEEIDELKKKMEEHVQKYKSFESSLTGDERSNHNKLITMNKSLINLKQMYQQLVNTKVAEGELKILQKKLRRKDQKYKQLENELVTT